MEPVPVLEPVLEPKTGINLPFLVAIDLLHYLIPLQPPGTFLNSMAGTEVAPYDMRASFKVMFKTVQDLLA